MKDSSDKEVSVPDHPLELTALDVCGARVVDGEKVAAVRQAMPDDDDVAELADVLGLLGDQTRLKLLTALLEAGEMCVCDLAASTGQAESTVSHALRLLRAHRVVAVRRDRRMAFYRLADAHVRLLLDVGLTHIGHTQSVHVEQGPEH